MLGLLLKPQRERKTLGRAMLHPKCPGRTANGKYNVPEWQAFFDEVGTIGHLDEEPRKDPETVAIERQLKDARLRTEMADARRRERENKVADGLLIEKKQAILDVQKLFSEVKLRLMRLPSQVAPIIVVKRDKAEAAEFLTDRLTAILEDLVTENVGALGDG